MQVHMKLKLLKKRDVNAAYVADRLDISVFRGDGTDIRTLKKAEAHKAGYYGSNYRER